MMLGLLGYWPSSIFCWGDA